MLSKFTTQLCLMLVAVLFSVTSAIKIGEKQMPATNLAQYHEGYWPSDGWLRVLEQFILSPPPSDENSDASPFGSEKVIHPADDNAEPHPLFEGGK